jgi:hypothetical protein
VLQRARARDFFSSDDWFLRISTANLASLASATAHRPDSRFKHKPDGRSPRSHLSVDAYEWRKAPSDSD